jgi:two-component system sensor histidine kinase UhpB
MKSIYSKSLVHSKTVTRQNQVSKAATKAAIRAQEKERNHLGKELHDNINQILTTTRLYIEMALAEESIREMLLHKSLENVSKAIEEIRKLSKSLVSPSLEYIGLREAVQEMITGLNISKGLQIKLKTQGLKESIINDQVKLMIYRVLQEQVNNIIKHSKAKNAEIRLSVSNGALGMVVTDDGIGFDLCKKRRGIGLNNINSRVEIYGGTVQVITSPGKGCSLQIQVPL